MPAKTSKRRRPLGFPLAGSPSTTPQSSDHGCQDPSPMIHPSVPSRSRNWWATGDGEQNLLPILGECQTPPILLCPTERCCAWLLALVPCLADGLPTGTLQWCHRQLPGTSRTDLSFTRTSLVPCSSRHLATIAENHWPVGAELGSRWPGLTPTRPGIAVNNPAGSHGNQGRLVAGLQLG